MGGSILGSYGSEVIAEEITQNLPMILPLIETTSQSQTLAHLLWTSCMSVKLFSTSPSVIAQHPDIVHYAKSYLFLLIADMLERQMMAPSAAIAFPVTFLTLAVSLPQCLHYAQVWRIARALKMLEFHNLAMLVLNVSDDPKSVNQFLDFNELLF